MTAPPSLRRKFLWLGCWGAVFGYIEAALVVYLRRLYYPSGFSFPAVVIDPQVAAVEIVRELATLLLMWAVAALAFETFRRRFAAYMILFGVWDVFYYLFLKLILGWPGSLATWDILFLVPLPWVGPVWAPVAVSAALIGAGSAVLLREERGRIVELGTGFVLLEAACGMVIIVSFLIPGQAVIRETVPQHFPWYLFLTGLGTGVGAFIIKMRGIRD